VRLVAANLHPDHDTIAVFRRTNKAAFEAAFLQVLLRIDANASKIRSVRYERANDLRARLTADIAALTAQAEAAAAEKDDPQALPAEIGRRGTLKARLDAACGSAASAAGQSDRPGQRVDAPLGRA